MSLKHILLGILSEPHSGYDIKKHFEVSLKNFWNAELSQIYPLLQKMEKDGLLHSKANDSQIGPTRRVYSRSSAGGDELRSWLDAGPVVGAERVAHLAQIYFLAALDDTLRSIAFFQELQDYMAGRLAVLEAIEKEWKTQDSRVPDALPASEFYSHMTLKFGLAKMRMTVEWCEECIARIRARVK
jgi:DNA-binding PadR family transcriptional regulator